MTSATRTAIASRPTAALGRAWLLLSFAVAAHIADEALTGFLGVWNPTVAAVRARLPWAPLPTFRFDVWLTGLILLVLVLLAFSPAMFRGARWMRPIAYILAIVMIGNGLGHLGATIAGRTVATVRFPRPAPGFYSSPLLLVAGVWLIIQLRRTRSSAGNIE